MERRDRFHFWRKVQGVSEEVPAHVAETLVKLNPNDPRVTQKAEKIATQLEQSRLGDQKINRGIAGLVRQRGQWAEEQQNKK